MLFLLRCIFWLSIVYASISWPSDPLAPVVTKASAAREVRDILSQTLGIAQAGAGKACLHAPAACLEGAAHLSSMAAGWHSGGNKTNPPTSMVVDAPAAAN